MHNEDCDNCPICRATKKAEKEGRELGGEELMEAFQEAKEQGGMVGTGEDLEKMFEKDK